MLEWLVKVIANSVADGVVQRTTSKLETIPIRAVGKAASSVETRLYLRMDQVERLL